jgi:predicted benzoate:H+ symporter BenE
MRPDWPLMILGGAALASMVGATCTRSRWRIALAAIAAALFAAEAVIRGEHRDWLTAPVYAACAVILAARLGRGLLRDARLMRKIKANKLLNRIPINRISWY